MVGELGSGTQGKFLFSLIVLATNHCARRLQGRFIFLANWPDGGAVA